MYLDTIEGRLQAFQQFREYVDANIKAWMIEHDTESAAAVVDYIDKHKVSLPPEYRYGAILYIINHPDNKK